MRAAVVRQFGPAKNILFESCYGVPELSKTYEGSSQQLLVQVFAAGVNPVDTYIRAGDYNPLPKLPYIPGKEGAGIVVQAPNDDVSSNKHRVGDRVWFTHPTTGSCAEYCLVPVSHCFTIPQGITFGQASTLGVAYMTAFRALTKACIQPGNKVLIHGASGGVGLAAAQIAANVFKARVFGTVGSDWGREQVLTRGCLPPIYDHTDSPAYLEQIRAEHSEGFDVILEMAAHKNLNEDLTLVAIGGRIIVVGSRSTIRIDPRRAMVREASIIGQALGIATDQDLQATGDRLNQLLAEGTLSSPCVNAEFSLERVSDAHLALEKRTMPGKLIIRIQNVQ